MTISSNNFDIYSITNKASAKDKATIFFDEVLTMSIAHKRKFNDQEMEALRDSFKGNQEADLFNTSLHNCLCINLLISQIEKIISDTNHIETSLRITLSAIDDNDLVSWLISDSLKEAEKSGCFSNKKEAKKIFNNLKDKIQKLCSMSIGNVVVKKLVKEVYQLDDEEKDQDFYNEKFLQFFRNAIATKADTANKFLDVLKDFYAKSDAKFEVVDGKIKDLEEKIGNLRKFYQK